MMHQSAIALGVGVRVLSLHENESAAQVANSVQLGRHDDLAALIEFAESVDVLTFDHEHVPNEHLVQLEQRGFVVRPGSAALKFAQDKALMRERLSAAGIPCPRWRTIANQSEGEAFAAEVGWPLILKTSRGGYDGKGVWRIENPAELIRVLSEVELQLGAVWLAEELVPLQQELAAQVARSPRGQMISYPVVRTVQSDGICTEVISPAPGMPAERVAEAQRLATRVADALDCVGMLAVELFDTGDQLLVNELAMRPHNSGHWSIDGAHTSQFENHLRAVLDLPLGRTSSRAQWNVMVNLLGGSEPDVYANYRACLTMDPGVRIHMYGKEVRPGRKIGHVTVSSDDLDNARSRAHAAAKLLTGQSEE